MREANQLVDAGYGCIHRPCGDQAQHPGHLDFITRRVAGQVRQPEERKGGWRRLSIPHRLDGGDLHLLVDASGVAGFIPHVDNGKSGGKAKTRRNRHRALGEFDVPAFEQVPSADRQHEHRAGHIAGTDGMHIFCLRDRIEQHGHEVADFHAHRVDIEMRPTGNCIQPLAIRIHSAEKLIPSASAQVAIRCCTLVIRSHAKKNNPTKVASRKNAIRPSMARGAPNTSPT